MTTMKPWPSDGSMIVMSDALDPLKRVLEAGYEPLQEKLITTDIPYDGYVQGPSVRLAVNFDLKFSEANRRRKAEEHLGLIDLVLEAAFQLGFEQGNRNERKNRVPHVLSHREFRSVVQHGIRNATMDDTSITPSEWTPTALLPYTLALDLWLETLTEIPAPNLAAYITSIGAPQYEPGVDLDKLFHGVIYALASNKAVVFGKDRQPLLLSLEPVTSKP